MIKVLLVEDHHIVRQGFKALLEDDPEITVIGETGDGLEAVSLAQAQKPDVVIVDIGLPNMNGLDVTKKVKAIPHSPHVIILSMYAAEVYVLRAFKNGASGYVVKSATDDLVYAVKQVVSGNRFLGSPFAEKAIDAYLARAATSSGDYESLTSREREVLQYLAEGSSAADVASLLNISPRTVEVHRSNIMAKLKLNSSKEIVKYAALKDIISD